MFETLNERKGKKVTIFATKQIFTLSSSTKKKKKGKLKNVKENVMSIISL